MDTRDMEAKPTTLDLRPGVYHSCTGGEGFVLIMMASPASLLNFYY